MKHSQPWLEPVPGKDQYKLVVEYTLSVTVEETPIEITVPKDFIYDGASIPSFAWTLIYTPFHPDMMLPALIHDYLYKTHETDRDTADSIFYYLLIENGVEKITAEVMHAAVRIGGGSHW